MEGDVEGQRNPRRKRKRRKSGNGIGRVVPDGYHTRSMAAAQVGRSIDTLKRWQETGVYKPTTQMVVGSLRVWLYSDADIELMKEVAAMQRPGKKAKPKTA